MLRMFHVVKIICKILQYKFSSHAIRVYLERVFSTPSILFTLLIFILLVYSFQLMFEAHKFAFSRVSPSLTIYLGWWNGINDWLVQPHFVLFDFSRDYLSTANFGFTFISCSFLNSNFARGKIRKEKKNWSKNCY